MSLSERLAEYIAACFTGLWLQSAEQEEALKEIAKLCHDRKWRMASWDIDRGLCVGESEGGPVPVGGSSDPLAAIRSLNALAKEDGSAVLVLLNFHRFLNSAEIVQAVAHQIASGKHNRTFIVVLSPVLQIPVELEKHFIVLHHDLPDRSQMEAIARGVGREPGDLPDGDGLAAVLDSAAGLTRFEAEGAFSLSIARHGRITPETVWELKCQTLKKSGLLNLYRGGEAFADLGGMDAMKSFCLCALRPNRKNPLVRPRGIMILGVPGTGKSAFAKALGRETGRPTLVLDIGALLGSLVGQSEANIRQALRIADAMSPAILFCDEIEKALAGVASSGQSDSGVSARLFGSLLGWLNDHTSDVFTVATCNDISKLPPEFSRAERWDGVWFLDLPSTAEKATIWKMYLDKFGLDAEQARPHDESWTGAEVRACCRLAALLDVPLAEAAKHVVPVAVTANESVERLRNWASGRCLSAYRPGIYMRDSATSEKPVRKVTRPSSN